LEECGEIFNVVLQVPLPAAAVSLANALIKATRTTGHFLPMVHLA